VLLCEWGSWGGCQITCKWLQCLWYPVSKHTCIDHVLPCPPAVTTGWAPNHHTTPAVTQTGSIAHKVPSRAAPCRLPVTPSALLLKRSCLITPDSIPDYATHAVLVGRGRYLLTLHAGNCQTWVLKIVLGEKRANQIKSKFIGHVHRFADVIAGAAKCLCF
jgi:hypothetical protein